MEAGCLRPGDRHHERTDKTGSGARARVDAYVITVNQYDVKKLPRHDDGSIDTAAAGPTPPQCR